MRLATENHLCDGSKHLSKLLAIAPSALIGSEPLMVLGELGLSPSRSTAVEFAKWGPGLSPVRSSYRTTLTRICPKCLDEMPVKHVLASWDRPFQFRCDKHELLLVDSCEQCGQPISHLRKHLLRCNCGAHLLGLRQRSEKSNFGALYEALDLREIYAHPARTFAASSQADYFALIFCRRLMAIQESRRLGSRRSSMKQFKRRFMRHEEIEKVLDVFTLWPRRLHDILEQHHKMFNEVPSAYLMNIPLCASGVLPAIKVAVCQWSFPGRY